eukprot:916119-Pelagomonas_calceolata.AAC.1
MAHSESPSQGALKWHSKKAKKEEKKRKVYASQTAACIKKGSLEKEEREDFSEKTPYRNTGRPL